MINSTLTLAITNNDPSYTISGLFKDTNGTPVINAPVYLSVSVASINYEAHLNDDHGDFWRYFPGVGNPVHTDTNGHYSFTITLGTASPFGAGTTIYFITSAPATGTVNGSASQWQQITETHHYPAQSPQQIQYQVMLDPASVNNGMIQYFAANGYTVCYLIAAAGSNANNYAAELAIIKALGMTPILDIEMIVGNWWNNGDFSVFASYFAQMKAAGWTTVASEVGWHTGVGTTNDCVAYARQYFSGYVNFHISEGNMTSGNYRGIYIDPGTTANVWESYYDDMVERAIEPGTDACAALDIPCGILAGGWAASWNKIWANSLAGTGNTYQSLMGWSYSAGVGFSFFAIDLYGSNHSIANYTTMGFPGIVAQLQETYPPAGTSALVSPTILASNMTLSITQNPDNTYLCTGRLTALVSGNPIANKIVTLDVSADNATWITETTDVTDANGDFSWSEVALTTGTCYLRVHYAGDATHLAFNGPNGDTTGVQVVVKAGVNTSLRLTAGDMTPTTLQTAHFTATLTTSGQPLAGQPITINYYTSSGTIIGNSTDISDINGQITATHNFTTAGYYNCTAVYAGEIRYSAITSAVLTVEISSPTSVTPVKTLVDENCEIDIRDENLEDDGEIRNFVKFSSTLRLNDVSSWQIDMHSEDFANSNLELGSGIMFRRDNELIMSGPVMMYLTHYVAGDRTTSIYGGDDNYWLIPRICYPVVSGMIFENDIWRFGLKRSAEGLMTSIAKATTANDNAVTVVNADGFQPGAQIYFGDESALTATIASIDYPQNVLYTSAKLTGAYPLETIVTQTGTNVTIDDPTYLGYDVRTGDAETVMKELVYYNAGEGACIDQFGPRAIPHLIISNNYGRGSSVTSNARGEVLLSQIQNLSIVGQLYFQIKQVGTDLVFDVFQGNDLTENADLEFSVRSGNLKEYQYSVGLPVANMLIGVGPNPGAAKVMMPTADPASIAQFGRFESWMSASQGNASDTNAEISSAMAAANQVALLTEAYTSSVTLTLQETDQVRYPRDFNLGDKVRIMIGDVPTDQIVTSLSYDIPAGSGSGTGSALTAFYKKQMSRLMTRQNAQGDLIRELLLNT